MSISAVLVAALVMAVVLAGRTRPRLANRRFRMLTLASGNTVAGRAEPLSPVSARASPYTQAGLARFKDLLLRRLERRSTHDRRRRAAIELVAAFAAELRAGQPVRQAFVRAQQSSPVGLAVHAVAVADLGGDVPLALDDEARDAQLPVLRSLAALWRVAEGSGAGLAQAADRLAVASTEAELARAELSAQLAGPRATARVLAGLPLLGMLLGSGLGASPVSWLFGSVWGWLVLVVGLALEALGLWWIARLTRSVEVLL